MTELREDLLPWAHLVKRSLLAPPLPGQPDTRPYFIYTEEEAAAFYTLTPELQRGWQRYCEAEAKAFDDANSYDKQVYLYHKWAPDLSLYQWLEHNR